MQNQDVFKQCIQPTLNQLKIELFTLDYWHFFKVSHVIATYSNIQSASNWNWPLDEKIPTLLIIWNKWLSCDVNTGYKQW